MTMARTSPLPRVFIGSSTEAIRVADAVRQFLVPSANSTLWNLAFPPGTWTLQVILNHAQESDFGIFVIAPDDALTMRGEKQRTVRDNVLFEIGLFMGALGPERTFILWPSGLRGRLRLPSDLLGITMITYDPAKRRSAASLARVLHSIQTMGPALRSSYNEILALDRLCEEREQILGDGSPKSHKAIVGSVAVRRKSAWSSRTPVELSMRGIRESYKDKIVDNIFWWLIVDGVVTFDNIDVWTDGKFHGIFC